jgi:uncharacterized protein (TIGR02594 family)
MQLSFQPFKWTLDGASSFSPPHLEIDASLKLPLTLSFANGTEVKQDFYFVAHPQIDPEIKLSGGGLEVDLSKCPWYAGLTEPPKDLKIDGARQDKETQARKDFLARVLQGAGDDIRTALSDLLQLPSKLFAQLRAQVTTFLHDHVFGPFTKWLDIEDTVTRRIERILNAVEHMVRDAMGWLLSLARDVAKWLLTTADKLAALTSDACRSLIDGFQVLCEGVLDGAKHMAEVLQEAFVTMAKDPAKFARQIKAAIISLVQDAAIAAKDFAGDLEKHLAWALTQLIRAAGMAEAKVRAFFQTVAEGIAAAANKVGVLAKEVPGFFSRLLEATVHGLHTIADDPGVLYVWIGKLIRWGLEGFVKVVKLTAKWIEIAADAIGRAARALGACIADFAKKTADAIKPYAKAVLEALADVAKTLGKVTREAFAEFLRLVAGWSRTLFHAVCEVLRDTEALLVALIGPEVIAEVKQALGFLCDFLEKVGEKVEHAIDTLYNVGHFVAVELPEEIAKIGGVVEKKIAGLASSLGNALENAFRILVLQVGNYLKHDPLVQALVTLVKAMIKLGEMAGVAISDKVLQVEKKAQAKIDEALRRLDDMCLSLATLLSGTGDGQVIEARFRSLSVAKPTASKRSQAKIDILSDLPVIHKLTGDDVLLPALQAVAGKVGIEIGALEVFGYDGWRFSAPHPVRGDIDLAPDVAVKTRFLPVPFSPKHDVVFRLCLNPRLWVIDPRYSWGYGASNQLRLADIDGDGKVDEWEARRTAQTRKADPDADPFTAEDLQSLLDQVENVLHGVPYRQIGAPFGVLAGYEGGSWAWFSVASIGDEDVGGSSSMPQGQDPKAKLGSVLRTGGAGTIIPSGEKVNRSGIGLFWQGMQCFGAKGYPVHYHIEQRMFWDQFASGFSNPGTSTFLVLRGGHGGNDFQLRSELYGDFLGRGSIPIGMYTPTIRLHFGINAAGGAAAAAAGGFRLGLEYASPAPIAVLMGDVVKEEDKNKSAVDKVIEKLKKDFKVDDILPLMEAAAVPILRLLMFDQELEAKLVCAGTVGIGPDLAITKKRQWASGTEGRRRTLHMLDRAETFWDDWKQTEELRRQEAALRAQTPDTSKSSSERLEAQVKQLWATSKLNDEVRKDLTEIAQLHRAFMRAVLGEATSPDSDVDAKFKSWLGGADPSAKLAALEKWLSDQRKSHYFTALGNGAKKLKDLLWKGDVSSAWDVVKEGLQKIDATTGECADDLCECILALASLLDIFHRMATALGDVKGLKGKIAKDLQDRRKAREEKAAKPLEDPPTILGRMGNESGSNRWAQEVLAGSDWGSSGTGLADGLSLVWSIDGGIGVGAGGAAGGAGLGAFAVAGMSVSLPSFKLPGPMLAKLSSKLMLVRFLTRFLRSLCEVLEYELQIAGTTPPKDPGGLYAQAAAWYVQAIHQTLKEILRPGSDAQRGHDPDPMEDWLFGFLSGTTLSMGAKVEGMAKAVGTVLAAEARGSMGADLSISLASLLDPLIEAIQQGATRNPGDKASLGARIIPKFNVKVNQTLTGGVAAGPAQVDLGLTGQSLAADLLFPDGSPWRHSLESWIRTKIDEAVDSDAQRAEFLRSAKEQGGFLEGFAAVCTAVDRVLKTEIIPSVLDYEKKTGADGPGKATALVTNPSVQRMFDVIRDPEAAGKKRDEKKRRIDELIDVVRTNALHFGEYPDQPQIEKRRFGMRTTSAPSNAFNILVLLPDAEVAQFSPKSKFELQKVTYRIPLDPAPAHVAQNTYRQKSDPKATPINGVVVGFAKKAEAEAFVKQRKSAWVDSSVASVPPWPSPRAGESGTAQWYHWLNTKLFPAIEEAQKKKQRIDHPKLTVDDKGVLLTFELVARGLLDKAPFDAFGMVKEKEELLTEATILEGAWEDDVARLRSEIADCIFRGGKPIADTSGAGGAAGATAGAPSPSSGPPSATAPVPSATPTPSIPSVSPLPATPSVPSPTTPGAATSTVRYSVKRAQVSVNHRLRDGGIPGWTQPLSTDGRFGPKTGAALDAWGKSLGASPVQADKGAAWVMVDKALAQALDEAHDSSVVACAPPHPIPEDDAPWMAIARGEMGQKEIKGAEDNPRIREYHAATSLGAQHDEVAWCSSFVNWCLMKAGIDRTHSAAAASWVDWGVDTDPRRGAIVVIYNAAAKNSALTHSGNHVGFLVEDLGWGWKVLGGNQGDMVKESCFSKKKWALKAVKWPS